jgi:hypothetical protein
MRLNPKHLTLDELLQGRLFRIPNYQRAYAWVTKQRTDLFEDIREVQRSGRDHFMATIVCLARDKRRIVADEYQTVDVVDGQQRLTTFIILFKSIEKVLNEKKNDEKKIKRQIGELLVKGDDHSLLLLQTNHDSSNVFLDYIRKGSIHEEATTEADRNLIDAANECETFVDEWRESSNLVELVALLRNSLSAIYHELTDEAVVYRVFEVLNSRGLDVKWIDKLKSQLMALIFTHAESGARADGLVEMQSIWKSIYSTLGLRGDLGDEALRFAGSWKFSPRPNRLLSEADAESTLTGVAGTKLKAIVETGRWLKSVVEAVDRLDGNVRLRAVTRVVQARFVGVAILLRKFSPETERKLLGQWERVTFRIFGLGGADKRNKVGDYIRLGYDIVVDALSDGKIAQALRSLGDGYSIEEVLEGADWTQSYEGWTEELRYVLFRYDEHLGREGGEKINQSQWNKIWAAEPSRSIEHIQPQSSGVAYIHHLGNLTMLPPGVNSSLKDKKPKDKASTYKQCGIRGTMAVGNLIARKLWSEKCVKKRAAKIEEFIRQEWAD